MKVFKSLLSLKHSLGGALALITRYVPEVSRIPLHQGLTWEPTLQVIPKSGVLSRYLESLGVKRDLAKSSFPVLPLELMAFTHLMRFVRAYGEEWSQGTVLCGPSSLETPSPYSPFAYI